MTDRTTGSDGRSADAKSTPVSAGDRWIADDALETPLPADVQTRLGRLLDEEPLETLGTWADACRRLTGGGPIAIEDFCHADKPTPHRGEMDGETYHFACFYDAVALAVLAESPVDVRTESPEGTGIRARATGDADLTVAPPEAAVSFGIDKGVTPPDGGPTREAVYGAVCPYVEAFPNRDAYERWARTAPAATVGMPLKNATELAVTLAK